MTIVLVILLAILGSRVSGFSGFSGFLWGGVMGYVLGRLIDLKEKITRLEEEVSKLNRHHEVRDEAAEKIKIPIAQDIFTQKKDIETIDLLEEVEEAEVIQAVSETVFTSAPPASVKTNEDTLISKDEIKGSIEQPEDIIVNAIRRLVTGGDLLVKTGVVILFFGVSFLLKYAIDHAMLPIEVRLAASAFGAVVLIVIGWRLRDARTKYALALQGGGVGILYLTIFTAYRLYSLIPPSLTFFLLVSICVLSSALAVMQNSISLAVLGVSGGFLAPLLASTGQGSHVALFTYYAILNVGIIGIAWFKAWRILNIVGFVFTFVISSMWGYNYYQAAYFSTTEPFLIVFFSMYTCIAILFSLRQQFDPKGYVDGILVFGTPVVAFGQQAMLVKSYEYGLAWSSFALGFFYITIAWGLYYEFRTAQKRLAEAFLAFGTVFATLAIPLAFNGRWTSAAWALEGAAVFWIGARQGKVLARSFGIFLLFAAGVAFMTSTHLKTGTLPVLNGFYLGTLLVAIPSLFTAYYIRKNPDSLQEWEMIFEIPLFLWGMLWWFGGGLHEIDIHVAADYKTAGFLLFCTASAAVCDFMERRIAWPLFSYPALGLLIAMILAAFPFHLHPFSHGGYISWPLAFAVYYSVLSRHDYLDEEILSIIHSLTLWLMAFIVAVECRWQTGVIIEGSEIWKLITWGIVSSLFVLGVPSIGNIFSWPVKRHEKAYVTKGIGPIAVFAVLWAVFANLGNDGDPWPLIYLPLLNPIDLATGLVLVSTISWLLRLRKVIPEKAGIISNKNLALILAIGSFAWFNAILVRTIHHLGGVPFDAYSMMKSPLFQTSVSTSWSLIALCTMVIATKKGMRNLWIAGSAILGSVVIKLFIIDLSKTGTVERIISFVGVGLLLLVIGYFSPIPPEKEEENK